MTITINLTIERTRKSVTQGYIDLYCNGVLVGAGFEDKITLNGQIDIIGSWGSEYIDNEFIKRVLTGGKYADKIIEIVTK